MHKPEPFQKESVRIGTLREQLRTVAGLDLTVCVEVSEAADRIIKSKHVHRPGLALAGYTELFAHRRIQVLGNTECRYLSWLSEAERLTAFQRLLSFDVPCVVLTAGNELQPELREAAQTQGVPILCTEEPTVPFMSVLRDWLEDHFSLQVSLHGSLVDVYGIGLLVTGRAGIGKSEVALDLVERGHRLVADDIVIASKKSETVLMGSGTELGQHFMEIRGLGVVDIRSMFGIRAIRYQKRIEVVVELHTWDDEEDYTRLGLSDDEENVLDVALPLVKLPIVPGKNVTVICEVIAMNYLLKHYGYDSAEVFKERLADRLEKRKESFPRRGIEWFETDTE